MKKKSIQLRSKYYSCRLFWDDQIGKRFYLEKTPAKKTPLNDQKTQLKRRELYTNQLNSHCPYSRIEMKGKYYLFFGVFLFDL